MAIFENWLLMAFAAPLLWALVNLIDVYFAKEVYKDEFDAAIISNLFSILPWFFIPIFGFELHGLKISLMAILGGIIYSFSFFFYFRSLFKTSDATLLQSIWNLSAIVTPILAFVFIDEKLTRVQYFGIVVVFLGAMVLSFNKTSKSAISKILPDMICAIFLFSISTIMEERVYVEIGFWSGFLLFVLGSFIAGVVLFVIRFIQGKTGHLRSMSMNFGGSFLLAEILALIAVMFYQMALSKAPAVSFVTVIEVFMPAFILIESVFIFFILKFLLGDVEKMKAIHDEQIVGWKIKFVAILIMATGVYVVNG